MRGGRSWLYNERGERQCARCGKYKPVAEFAIRNRETGVLHSYCLECKRAMNHHATTTPAPRPVWVPPVWSWGYCPVCGWSHSNGRGPSLCECGQLFEQRIAPAPVCEHIKA